MTLGVRVLVENEDGKVLLVRHTYVSGWYFPGGGVETGEHAVQTARKELREETGLDSSSDFELFGVYWNRQASKRDHVLFYKCRDTIDVSGFRPNREIAEIGFFPVDKLPQSTTPATLRRLDEVYKGSAVSHYW